MNACLLLFFASLSSAAVAAPAPDAAAYLAQRGWTPVRSTISAMPVSDIAPVIYMEKGNAVPGCGLLAHGSQFIPILSPEPGEQFPHCLGIPGAASFSLGGRRYLVVEYISRDTRNDFYREYFYVYKNAAGRYAVDEQLNDAAPWPPSVSVNAANAVTTRVTEGVRRALGTAMSKTVPGMTFLGREFIADGDLGFGVFHDKEKGHCAFVVSTETTTRMFRHDLFVKDGKCTAVLASSKLAYQEKTYFLVLFSAAGKNQLGVIAVDEQTAITAEVNSALATAQRGPLNNIKEVKAALAGVLGTHSSRAVGR